MAHFGGGLLVALLLLAGILWVVRWGPAQERWTLADVGVVLAVLLGGAGVFGLGCSWLILGRLDTGSGALLPGVLGTALAGGLATAGAIRRATPAALGLGRAAPWSWGVAVFAVPGFLALSAGFATALQALGGGYEEQQLLTFLADSPPLNRSVAVGYGVLGAPLIEEVVFRGFLLPPLMRRSGTWPAVVLAGSVFGLFHAADPYAVAPLVVLGIGLGWLRVRSGSLWPGVLVHVGNNAAAIGIAVVVAT